MIYPPLDELMEKVDCRYTLTVETAKRARQIVDGSEMLVENADKNYPVATAVEEIDEDKVRYRRDDDK